MAQIPQKLAKLGWAVQGSKGSAVTTPALVLPMDETGGLSTVKNPNYLRWADGRSGECFFTDRGEWYEGDIQMPLIPTTVAGTSGITALAITRGADWQGAWFSLQLDLGSNYQRTFSDCKVRSWRLTFEAGREPVLSLTIGALARSATIGTFIPCVNYEPYMVKEISVKMAAVGASLAANTTLKRVEISGDNMVTGFEDEFRLGGGNAPEDQPNYMGPVVEGTLDAEFSDSTLITAFENGSLMQLEITCARAGLATCVVTLPRIHFGANPLKGGGAAGMIMQDGVAFHALMSASAGAGYDTAAITMVETLA
jgi:hypothetical protein